MNMISEFKNYLLKWKKLQSVPMTLVFIFFGWPSIAEQISIADYLASVDRTSVSFAGHIKYDNGNFSFYDQNRERFGVTIDAGRDAREKIESECENTGLLFSIDDLCKISGSGTVEIRGSKIFISIEKVEQISK